MKWDFAGRSGVPTTLPVLDDAGNPEEGKTQKLYGIRLVSLPGREGKAELGLYPSVSFFTHAGEGHILDRLNNLLSGKGVIVYRGVWGKGTWPTLIIKFVMRDGESFCDTAIDLVSEILAQLGVEDEHNYILSNFTRRVDSFEKFEHTWVSFDNQLRIRHGLPLKDVDSEALVQDGDLD
jgi:hypothetical protein